MWHEVSDDATLHVFKITDFSIEISRPLGILIVMVYTDGYVYY